MLICASLRLAQLRFLSVDALLRLHKKTKTIDIYLDHGTEPSPVRQVWSEIRDGLERGMPGRFFLLILVHGGQR